LSRCRQIRYEASSAYYEFCAFELSPHALSDLEIADDYGMLRYEPFNKIEIIQWSGMEAEMWCDYIDTCGIYSSRIMRRILARIFPTVPLVRVVGGLNSEHGDYEYGPYGEEDVLCALQVGFDNKDLRVCFEKDY
jgi:hypothetical protein